MVKIFISTILFVSLFSFAQQKPIQQIPVNETAKKISLNDISGMAIVEAGEKLYGVKAGQSSPLWSLDVSDFQNSPSIDIDDFVGDLKSIKLSKELDFENIDGTPLIVITKGLVKALVNSVDGKILFNSGKENWATIASHTYTEKGLLFFENINNNRINIAAIDLKTGNKKWNIDLGDRESLKGFFQKIPIENQEKIKPKFDKNGNLYGYFSGKLVKINPNTGELLWKNDQYINNFDINNEGSSVIVVSTASGLGGFLGSKENLNLLNADNGTSLLKEPMRVDKIIYIEDLGEGFMLGSFSGTNVYDYKTGTKQWKKSISDDPRMMIKSDNGYIFVSKNKMNFIDQNGKEIWRRDIEISDNKDDAIIELKEKNGYIYYITSTYVNMVNKNTGEKIWKRNLKLEEKRPTFFAFDENANEYILYNDEKLFKFGQNTTERPEEFAKLRLRREKEVNNLELRPNGYLISGMGEVSMIGKDGKVIYQSYYDEPGGSNRVLKRIGLKTAGTIAALATSTVSYNGGPQTGLFLASQGSRDMAANIANSLFAMDKDMNKRYDASKEISDYKFFFTKEADNKVLVKVNKDNGNVEQKFIFNNNKPSMK